MSRHHHKGGERGHVTVEMTLVGIGILFTLVSIFEIARGMWIYQTLAHAIREGVRYAAVHGQNCYPTPASTNDCRRTMQQIATVIRNNGIGLDLATTQLQFKIGTAAATTCALNACGTAYWPGQATGIGTMLTITGTVPFDSALAMFWPGSQPVSFARTTFGATASEPVKF